jgi:hypothetical protein
MSNSIEEQLLAEVREIRKLIELLAEPAIAQRDAKLRSELQRIVGSSAKKQQSVFLMDGSHTQREIAHQTQVDRSDLAKMIVKLEEAGLLASGKTQPKLTISIPPTFFDANAGTK